MIQYQSTPDFYREYIEHGWLKDAAKAVHKYIKRWRNAAGKWVYQYKKPESHTTLESEMASKMLTNPGDNYKTAHRNWARYAKNKRWQDVQNARNRTSQRAAMSNAIRNFRVMGSSNRKDTPYKKKKGYSGNLTQRGYSGSKGSGENQRLRNLGTRRSSHDKYYWDTRRLNYISDRQDINGGFKLPSAEKSAIKKNKAPKKFQKRMAEKAANRNKKMRHDHYWSHPHTTQNHIQPHRSRPSWTYK